VRLQELRLLKNDTAAPLPWGAADFVLKQHPDTRRAAMAKGQMKSNKEARKPKKEKVKTIAANPSTKGGGGLEKLEHFKNS